jgi:signal transduction histidine kinase
MKREFELCSYKLNCPNFKTDFVKKTTTKLPPFELIKSKKEVFMLFDIPLISKKYYLKLSIPINEYEKRVEKIDKKLLESLIVKIFIIILTSIIFSFYVLKPLKKAYEINEEFIKDILHDFNTPISSIKANLYSLKKLNQENKYIKRIEANINSILYLQKNLQSFLNSTPKTNQEFDLKELIEKELQLFNSLYPHIKIENHLPKITLNTNEEAFKSIISNILSNAFKYNKKEGFVKIYKQNEYLVIEDNGRGIKNPDKIFERFYKESQRGIGIGMNIVKKLCDELNIDIKIESKLKKGTKIFLKIDHLEVKQ